MRENTVEFLLQYLSTGNTVGMSTSATSSQAFASTPTLAVGTTAIFKRVPLASPSLSEKDIAVEWFEPLTGLSQEHWL